MFFESDKYSTFRKIISCSCGFWKVNRWINMIVGSLMMLIAGTPYLFSIFGPFLKEQMGYKQSEIDLVGSIGNIGTYFGFVLGLFYDFFGPRPTSLLCGFMMSGGYFLIWAAAQKFFESTHIEMGLFFALVGFGSGGIYTAAMAPNIYNFDKAHRGKITGFLASLFGLSSALFAQLYKYAFAPNMFLFFMTLAIVLGAVSLLGAVTMNVLPNKENPDESPLLPEPERPTLDLIRQYNPLQLFITLDFYAFFVAFICGVGSGLVVVNNIGATWLSLGGQPGNQANIVTVFSVCNFIGRLSIGTLSDFLLKYLNRPIPFAFSMILMGIGHLILAFSDIKWIYFGVVVVGLAYGGIWGTSPAMAYEIWGEKFWGTNFGLVGLAPTVGSYLLATLMAGKIYEDHVISGTNCYGRQCFEETFLICVGVCGFGFFVSMFLYLVTRQRYRLVYASKKIKFVNH